MTSISPLPKPKPLNKLAYEHLRTLILSGELSTDTIYSEIALAEQLGVSRTPVREALLELSSQGLVTFLPRKGIKVNYFTIRDVEEVFELRSLVELRAVEKAATRATAEDIAELEDALAENERGASEEDEEMFLEGDRRFHFTIARLVENSRLLAAFENLRDMVHMMSVQAVSRHKRMREVVEEHRHLLAAIEEGNVESARTAMSEHMDASEQAVLDGHRSLAKNGGRV